jgi:hypothetical protein
MERRESGESLCPHPLNLGATDNSLNSYETYYSKIAGESQFVFALNFRSPSKPAQPAHPALPSVCSRQEI